jgi:hypothetical protein
MKTAGTATLVCRIHRGSIRLTCRSRVKDPDESTSAEVRDPVIRCYDSSEEDEDDDTNAKNQGLVKILRTLSS